MRIDAEFLSILLMRCEPRCDASSIRRLLVKMKIVLESTTGLGPIIDVERLRGERRARNYLGPSLSDLTAERWPSGRRHQIANLAYPLPGTEGSNPSLSAKLLHFLASSIRVKPHWEPSRRPGWGQGGVGLSSLLPIGLRSLGSARPD